ncbi:MAG: CRTAC1 family protein [Acidobacteriota bacterium]
MTDSNRFVRLGLVAVLVLTGCSRTSPPESAPSDEPPSSRLFVERSAELGIEFVHVHGGSGKRYLPETMGAGGCALDHDADGRMDLYLVQSGALPGTDGSGGGARNRLFANRGDDGFVDVTVGARVGDDGYGMGATCDDHDGDGDVDIYLSNFGPNVLLENDGSGTFSDVTDRAGVGDPRWSSSAAFLDADGDGQLDLHVVNYLEFTVATHRDCVLRGVTAYCHPDAYSMAPDTFYRGLGGGRYEEATVAAGLVDTTGKGLGIVVGDIDDDGDPDVYVANDSTPNFLHRNDGTGRFEEIGWLVGVGYNADGETEAGMGTDMGDVNADGHPDLFVTNLDREANALYLGGPELFSFATRSSGLQGPSFPMLGFGTDLLDLDNDGDLDLFVTNGHVMDNIAETDDGFSHAQRAQVFLNDAGRFTELAADRLGAPASPIVGRGTITTDLDDDGRLDVVVTCNDGPVRVFQNTAEDAGAWIGFSLVGTTGHASALGARVTVETAGRRLTEERRSGSSYQTSQDPRLHFGLGDAQVAERVTVRWPGGAEQVFADLACCRYYRLVEGEEPR